LRNGITQDFYKIVSENQSVKAAASHATDFDLPLYNSWRLLLDSRVVDVTMAYNPPFVMRSSLKPFFFNGLKHKLRFSDNTGT